MLREIYLDDGWWSVIAWFGTVLLIAVVASMVIGALDLRTPRIKRKGGRRAE